MHLLRYNARRIYQKQELYMSHLLPTITHILARRPSENFADGLTTAELGQPDFEKAMQQYAMYLDTLRGFGLDVTVLEADSQFPDGCFVEDPLVILRDMAFVCRSGAEARRGEADSLLPHLGNLRVISAEAGAFIDGGDVLICADRVLIGLSERTNEAGATALKQALQTVQTDMRVDFVQFEGVLHLKSGLTEVAAGVLVHDPALKTEFDLSWAKVISLPPEEGYAADVMPVNDTIVIAAGFPTMHEIAARYYPDDKIVALDMSEFRKMDGGLTCLSLRYSV